MSRLLAGVLFLFLLGSSPWVWPTATGIDSNSDRQSAGYADAAVPSARSAAGVGQPVGGTDPTLANLKIAFIGDQGLGPDAVAVLNLIKAEGARAVVHVGDFDYVDDPAAWDAQINGVLGENFPYFATIGNHDENRWDGPEGYQQFLMNRLRRAGIAWDGDLGVQSSLRYEGIFLLLTAPGVRNTPRATHEAYIREQLAADRSTWSISAWHKNMERMQAGGKDNDTGWGVYEESANGGAVIITGHEHSYSRSHLLSNISKQTVASTSDVLTLTKGQSFVVVTGLGGHSIRRERISGPWWARVYASACLRNDRACQPDAAYGAFFGVFNVDGTPNKASFYFKDVNGKVVDRFTVFSRVESVTQTTQD
jgi:Calcineurin-like phosphoesterase